MRSRKRNIILIKLYVNMMIIHIKTLKTDLSIKDAYTSPRYLRLFFYSRLSLRYYFNTKRQQPIYCKKWFFNILSNSLFLFLNLLWFKSHHDSISHDKCSVRISNYSTADLWLSPKIMYSNQALNSGNQSCKTTQV